MSGLCSAHQGPCPIDCPIGYPPEAFSPWKCPNCKSDTDRYWRSPDAKFLVFRGHCADPWHEDFETAL